jgi:hypothetical protein
VKNTINENLELFQKFQGLAIQVSYESDELYYVNNFLKYNVITKSNFTLLLDKEYKVIYKDFSKGRKHAVQQGLKNQFTIEEIPFSELLVLSKENYSFKEIKENEYSKLSKLVEVLKRKNKTKIIGVKVNGALIGGSVFLLDSKRIVYLFSALSQEGKKKQVASLLLNTIIEEYASTNKILDFEGSQLPGIKNFFKSFGAKKESYFLLKKWWL